MATKFIPITIQLNLGNAQAQLSKLGGQLSGFGSKLSGFGQSSSLFVTAPLTAFGGAAIKAATDLDSLKRLLLFSACAILFPITTEYHTLL